MHYNTPLVSIITPSYNNSKFINKTIESVINQTYSNWEMIIVDDCSTDNSIQVIQKYLIKDERITLLVNKNNIGAAETRNKALRIAKGKYIAFLDSDDLWLPQKLEKQLNFMLENNIAFSFSNYEVIKSSGESINKVIRVPQKLSYNQYLCNTIIGCLTVIVDKSKTGYFEMPNIKSSHDMALWLLLMKRGYFAFGYNECLAKYRLVGTSNTAKKYKAAADVWRVYRKIEKLSLLKSAFCFVSYSFMAVKKRL
jgi:teichuronic acid biosynthesis glycosyltransferase TuaG